MLPVLSSLEVVLAEEDEFSFKNVGNLAMREQQHRTWCVSSVLGNSSVVRNSEHRPAPPPFRAERRSIKRPSRGKISPSPTAGPVLERRPRLKACLCSVTSGCSRRGSRPTSAGWWRSCSRSSPMRRSTWTPGPSAAGPAPWWGTLGT